MTEPRIQYAKTSDGVSIACTVIGRGPAIVYGPLLFGDIGLYTAGVHSTVDMLVEAGRAVVLYDGRGSGASDRDVKEITLESMVRDLESVVERTGFESVALFGGLHGGPPAIAYAVKHPKRLTHLVLVDSYISGSDYYTASPYTRAIKPLSDMAEDDWEFFTLTLANWSFAFRNAAAAKAMADVFRVGMSPQVYRRWLATSELINVRKLLPQVTVPTLVIQDRLRVLSDPGASRSIAAAIPGAHFVSVRGLEAVAQAVLEFTSTAREDAQDAQAGPRPGLATILFTDLASSTALTQRLGDANAQELVRAHNTIVREALAAWGGVEIKHTGDGIMASFPTASGALDCAVAIQRGVALRNDGDLQVHIGLNAGEPVAEEQDLFGTSVQLARRICDHAGTGQILASNVVRELSAGKGFLFADIGEVVPKGFEEPVRLYEVRWRE